MKNYRNLTGLEDIGMSVYTYQLDVLEIIPMGKENARTGEELGKQLNCEPRAIRYAIQALRLKGCPIIAKRGGGYFLPDPRSDEDMAETRQFIAMMRAQASERFATVHALGSWLKQVESKQTTWIK